MMSRYQWPPAVHINVDRPDLRAAYNAAYDAAVPPEVLEEAAETAREEAARASRDASAARSDDGADDTAGPATRRDALRQPPTGTTSVWVPVGPSEVVQGQATGRPRVAGRVRDLQVSPDGQRAYAATANGGVWFSSDRGRSWSPLGGWAESSGAREQGRPANVLVCGALLITFGANADGSGDDVYVGTGELTPRFKGTPGGKLGGVGVLHLHAGVSAAISQPFNDPWRREARNLTGEGIYRLARNPAGDTLAAATSRGLFTRSGAFVADADWARVNVNPLDIERSGTLYTTDVAWTPAAPPHTPERLWIAVVDRRGGSGDRTGVYFSENGTSGPFQRVALDGVQPDGRIGFGLAPSNPGLLYALAKGPRLWRIEGTTARRVSGIPDALFGTPDQSYYDLDVAVHPANANVVVLGGSYVKTNMYDASLFRLNVSCPAGTGACSADFDQTHRNDPAADATYIGYGVHADVHAIRFAGTAPNLQLWIGCDGGVFQSLHNGDANTFLPRNQGLAVIEAGYVACHPTHDGAVLIGTQDNGVLRRMGDSLWELVQFGDGGSVLFHPASPGHYVSQYTRAVWYSNGSFSPPVKRPGNAAVRDGAKTENESANFYSGADVVAAASGPAAHLALGTNRVWVSDNWDPQAGSGAMQWRTLPTGTDPFGAATPDLAQDTFHGADGKVIGVRWVDRDRLLVLCQRAVLGYVRGNGTQWTRHVLAHHQPKKNRFSNGDIPQPFAPYLPPLGEWSDIAVADPGAGPLGSFYVATTGHAVMNGSTLQDSPRMDTLWYYDGNGKWHPTGLRERSGMAPAYAIAPDPDGRATLYVGTANGVWRGVFAGLDSPLPWGWVFFSNGLPEAAVQDIAVFSFNGLKLVRAAIQARGVWEVDVSASPGHPQRTYLRVHPYDTRRQFPSTLVHPERAGSDYPWNMSPDIRLMPAHDPGAADTPEPPPSGLPWSGSAPHYDLWRFQVALREFEPLCVANARWSPAFARLVRRARAAAGLPHPDRDVIDEDLWNHVVTHRRAFSPPWGLDVRPAEADLHELVQEPSTQFRRSHPAASVPAGPQPWLSAAVVPERPHSAYVLVHHRDSRPVSAADVNVLLLERGLAGTEGDGADIAVDGAWKAAVGELLAGNAATLPAGWRVVGRQQPHAAVDARLSRSAAFAYTPAPQPAPPAQLTPRPLPAWLLLAVVSSATDPFDASAVPGATIRDVVLGSHHFAAKTLRRRWI